MKYEAVFSRVAANDIESLDAVAQKRLKKKLIFFLKDPLNYAQKLTNSREGKYRWRVGDLRVIFNVDGRKLFIVRVGHRREIYRK